MHQPVAVRAAVAADYDAACAITAQSDAVHHERVPWLFRAPETPPRSREWFAHTCAADASTILVAVDERVRGVAFLELRSPPPLSIFIPQRWAVLDSLVVDASCRRRGLGATLMAAAEAWARDKGAPWLELGVYAVNVEARAFYEALGYLPVSTKLRKPLTSSGPTSPPAPRTRRGG
jgi:GNAT superfamily N-acetyltransferase